MARNQLTRAGYERLIAEHTNLSKSERPKVVQGITEAAAEGDLSENAEYTYGKKKLRELDKRIGYLAELLKEPIVVDPATLSGDKVQFGATVVIEDEDGEQKTWTIVGEGEADVKERRISSGAPVAKALIGKTPGDLVEIKRPKGEIEVEIISVTYK